MGVVYKLGPSVACEAFIRGREFCGKWMWVVDSVQLCGKRLPKVPIKHTMIRFSHYEDARSFLYNLRKGEEI